MRVLPARLNDKPHYVFHPGRLLRRAIRPARPVGSAGSVTVATLPWGLELGVNGGEAIGYSILTGGVFDPCVTETIHRLIDPGDLVVDVGANVGYLTSLAATRAGRGGRVIAYEPHPHVYALLQANAARWKDDPWAADVELHQTAVSDYRGVAQLDCGPAFHENMGLASLRTLDAAVPVTPPRPNILPVSVTRLDFALAGRPIGVLKIDVEGHEPEVLRGARDLLESGLVRDVVFEDHETYPDASTEIVEGARYRLFALSNDLFGLRLRAPADRGALSGWPGPSYLATREPERALARLTRRGWQVAGIGPRRRLGRARVVGAGTEPQCRVG